MSAQKQQTLATSAALTGTSLHTGAQVTLTMTPAPVNTGIKFRRVDLPDKPFIDAHVSKVQTVERATTLAEGSVKVHTVEHVISALVGLGVDNAIIEMDANEPPIGDGSARPFVDCIKKAGIVEQDANRRVFEIREPIHLETPGGSILTIVPDKGFRVSCTQVGPNGRMTQYYSTEITPETYEREIAHARTFVYYEDVQPLLEKGLIKGGSLENAVVIKGDSVMSKEAMRYPEEFARHKILCPDWTEPIRQGNDFVVCSAAKLPLSTSPQWVHETYGFFLAVLTFAIVYGAFTAQVLYGAMRAVPHAQMETAEAYGMTHTQAFWRILVPQMWVYALPGLGNLWMILIKATPLLFLLGIEDIVYWARELGGTKQARFTDYPHGDWRMWYFGALLIFYLGLTWVSEKVLDRVMRRLSRGQATAAGDAMRKAAA